MSWNEPGGDKDKPRDPWSGRDPSSGSQEFDEFLRTVQQRFGRLFGRGGGRSGRFDSGGPGLWLILGIAVVLWGLTGFYQVDESQRAVITRFGKYIDTVDPGLHWHLPVPIERANLVNVSEQRYIEIGYDSRGRERSVGSSESLMLTEDENIVDVQLAVQFQIKDARAFLFNLPEPIRTLHEVTESVIRGVVGHNRMDFVLTEGRSEIVDEVRKEVQAVMDDYDAGIAVTSVNLQDAQPPDEVQSAFEDAIKAREDEQRLKNEAEAYSNEVIPRARGQAARLLEEADAYKQRLVARADGDARRFEQLLVQYEKAPEITRRRLYLETMEQVMENNSKVMVDVKSGSPLLYLPITELLKNQSVMPADAPRSEPNPSSQSGSAAPSAPAVTRDPARGRIGRGRQ